MKKVLIAFIIMSSCFSSFSQVTRYASLFDQKYKNVDYSKNQTNILIDRTLYYTYLKNINYLSIDTFNTDLFIQSYSDLLHAQVNSSNLFSKSINHFYDTVPYLPIIPIAILNFEYAKIDSGAFVSGRLFYTNDTLYEDTLIGTSTYIIDSTFIISPLYNYFVGDSIFFSISTDYIFSNISNINGIEIDFDDGLGYRIFSLSNTIVQINYNNDGLKILKFKINLSNNTVIEKKAKILYKSQELTPYETTTSWPTSDDSFYALSPFQGYLSFDLTNKPGLVSVRTYYANSDKKLRKPIIISDGFDPGNYRTFEMTQVDSAGYPIYRLGGIWGLLQYIYNGNTIHIGDTLLSLGYDLVIVDYPRGADYIERNGLAFIEVINRTNQKIKENGSNEQIVVVGPSMGGQISRYALAYMENNPNSYFTNNGNHNVRLWVSLDSPHQGANITYGIQALLKYLGEENTEMKNLYNRKLGEAAAAWQQLRYHIEGNSFAFNTYFHNINTLGFPINLRKIAITNGRLDGTMDGYAGMTALEMTFNSSNNNFAIVKYSPEYHNYGLVGDFNYLGFNNSEKFYLTEQENRKCIDASPGGWYPVFLDFKKAIDSLHLDWLFNSPVLYRYNSCFMPTKSTLAYKKNGSNYSDFNENITRDLVASGETPFDSYWGPHHENMKHVTFSQNLYYYLLNEIETYIFGEREINAVCDEKQIVLHLPYTVSNPNITWYCSDNLEIIRTNDPKIIKIRSISIGEGWVSADVSSLTKSYSLAKYPITVSHADNTPYPVIYDQTLSQTTTTWNTSYTLPQPITIESGKTLTISSTIYCAPNAKIIVQPGGKLILDGGKLTNYCTNTPWQGIVVEGNSNQSQIGTTPNQGVVIVKNNAIIENAICGIKVGDTQDPTKNGGIVYASETQFKNCKNSVLFAPYKNINNSVELANRSKFTDCEFIVDNNFYTTGMFFDAHAKLLGVNGITFTGCSFTNAQTTTYASARRYASSGISSFNSGFTVQPKCLSNLIPGEICTQNDIDIESSFTGLDYGIVAQGGDDFYKITVLSSKFNTNDYGIYLSGVNNAKILNNSFTIGKDINNIVSNPVGLYIQNGSGFRIEENIFNYNQNISLARTGLVVKNSGKENNQIYNNTFTNLTNGQIFDGLNYSTLYPFEGLVSLCNQNSDNKDNDFWVRTIDRYNYNGINQFQGEVFNTGSMMNIIAAGNRFSDPLSVDVQYNNEANFLFYLFNQNNSYETLYNYNSSTILPEIASENTCPSKINGLNIQTIQSELTNITFSYGNLKYNYNQLIDAGNTPELIRLIQDVWSEDIWNLRNQLMSKSPYLSQETIISVAQENLLPPALLLEICIANPDATKDQGFLDLLRYEIPTPLPEYMINLIIASWDERTLRTEMEEQLAVFKTYKDEYQNYKTEFLLSDTIYNYTDIINHLGTRGSYSDYLSMAEIALNQNDFVQANLYLDILEYSTEKLTSEEVDEISSFREYISIRESILLDTTTIYNLDSTQIAVLEIFASSNNYRGAILARNILCFLYDICIDDVPAPPKMLRIGSNGNNNQNTTPFIASVKVMPNPAHEYASFIWDMKSFDKNAILYIYDQNGKIIVTQPIDTKQGQWVWNIKNVPNGVYVYTLKSDQLILYSGKIIVNK